MCLEAFMVAGKLEFLFFLLSLEYTVFCTDQALAQSYVVVYIQCPPFLHLLSPRNASNMHLQRRSCLRDHSFVSQTDLF